MTDIPSRYFGSNPAWLCKTDSDLHHLFNEHFPFPDQASWTVFSPSSAVSMKVISTLWMGNFKMGEWLQLKKAGKHVGKIGSLLSNLWEWTLGYKMPCTSKYFDSSQALQLAYAQAALSEANKSQLAQSLGISRPLERQSLWPMRETPSNPKGATN